MKWNDFKNCVDTRLKDMGIENPEILYIDGNFYEHINVDVKELGLVINEEEVDNG